MAQTKTVRQEKLLRRLAEAKERLLESIAGLGRTALCTEKIIGDWTIKDILGHLVSWDREFRADIALILQGQQPGYERQISGVNDFHQWNEQWVAQKRHWPWRRIRADVDRDYQEAVQLITCLQPQDFRKRGITPWKPAAVTRPAVPTTADTDTVETLVTFQWRHINQHARMIEHWRKQKVRAGS